MILDLLANAARYDAVHPLFERAFEFLRDPAVLALSGARRELDGDRIVACPGAYVTRPVADARWEAHRRYIDIQVVLEGEELCGWSPLASMTTRESYKPTDDYEIFSGEGSTLHLSPGRFAIFFPEDVHAPGLALRERAPVRKLVLKVLLA